jgi:hypothetical protein
VPAYAEDETTTIRDELSTIRALADELTRDLEDVRGEVRDARAELGLEPALADPAATGNGAAGLEPLIAFVHIPKTAGGTATSMLAQAYSKSALHEAGNYMKGPEATVNKIDRQEGGWPSWQRKGGRVVVGHVPYRVFAEHLPPDTRYMAFLREPVDRVLSHYHRHIHDTRVGSVQVDSLERALELELPQLTNLMTRFLCSGSDLPSEPLHDGALEEAKKNLSGFAFAGIQERFDESLVLLQRLLGLELTTYVNRHVSGDRPDVEEIPAGLEALILEHNRLDAELYEFAAGLFEQNAEAAGEQVAREAVRLRGLSAEADERALAKASAFLERELPEGATREVSALLSAAREEGISGLSIKRVRQQRMYVEADTGEDGEQRWTRRSDAILEAAVALLEHELPEGVTRPKSELIAAANEAGVSPPALHAARDRLAVSRVPDDAGVYLWTRETRTRALPNGTGR